MGGRDHPCGTCGRGGFNDPDGQCECAFQIYAPDPGRWPDGSIDPKRILVCRACGCPRDLCEDRGCEGGPFCELMVVPVGKDAAVD